MADDLIETPVNDDGLVGVFVTPAGPGPHPALLTFGGSEGGLRSGQGLARFYATLGYSCLGVAYFAEDGLPSSLTQIPLEYLGKALVWLQNRPEVAPDKIGVMGGSRGGELALLLGAHFAEVKAVVAQAPSGVVWPAWSNAQGIVSSWTFTGQDLAYVPPTNAQPIVTQDEEGHDVYHYTPTFNGMLDDATPAEIDAASARAEDTMGPVLMIGGADDQLWPSCRLAEIAMARLEAAGHVASFADDFQCYPDAGHGLGSPGYPTTGSTVVQHPISKEWIELGGTPVGIAHANRESFERKRAFLGAALK
jgi:dienelactone hydrolase